MCNALQQPHWAMDTQLTEAIANSITTFNEETYKQAVKNSQCVHLSEDLSEDLSEEKQLQRAMELSLASLEKAQLTQAIKMSNDTMSDSVLHHQETAPVHVGDTMPQQPLEPTYSNVQVPDQQEKQLTRHPHPLQFECAIEMIILAMQGYNWKNDVVFSNPNNSNKSEKMSFLQTLRNFFMDCVAFISSEMENAPDLIPLPAPAHSIQEQFAILHAELVIFERWLNTQTLLWYNQPTTFAAYISNLKISVQTRLWRLYQFSERLIERLIE